MESEEELARCLWPWLSERLARVGDDALELERRLERGAPCSAQFELLRGRTESFGWLLGCVAEALGGAPPSPRRDARALGWMVDALCQVAGDRSRALAASCAAPTEPGVTRAQAWQCACTLWSLAGERPERELVVRGVGSSWEIADGRGGRWNGAEERA